MPDFDLRREDCRLLVIDMQERFRTIIPAIEADGACGSMCGKLLRGMGILDVPVLFSEQSPDKLGPTLPHLRECATDAPVLHKSAFSCCDDRAMVETLQDDSREWLVLCGIEAQVCVLATVDDLLRRGWNVVVAADAVASRNERHCDWALAAMRQIGALTLPCESILFRLQRDAGNEGFRELSKLIK